MISYSRDPHSVVPTSAVKIVGLGGAGANMLERLALDGGDPAPLVVLNTDVRTLDASLAKEKIQLGANLTKGLGTGGDPDLGKQAVLEAEEAVRAQLRGSRIVFICTGLGGGTGSGASPIVTRIAREEGAFVVVFATMPFTFEGKRRREQADASLNQLAVLSNALVTFDNNRMGELVLAKQGIHEAFAAADKMIGESIKAVIRLVTRPGLIHVGLDDLMSALRTTRSRCLFGSGIAEGRDRAAKALENALTSPLLDQGALLKETRTVLVHLCGGENLTLYEVELLMQHLQKHVPAEAQILFGASVDASLNDALSITLISSLPEDTLANAPREDTGAAAIPLPDPISPPPPVAPEEPAAKDSGLFGSYLDASIAVPESETKPLVDTPRPVTIAEFFSSSDKDHKEAGPPPSATTETQPESKKADPSAKSPKPDPAPPSKPQPTPAAQEASPAPADPPKLKLSIKTPASPSELGLDSAPRGRFEGESPNVFEGEDLDLPPFLRKKK